MASTLVATHLKCYHCGDDCPDNAVVLDSKPFCCDGCKTVYEILNQNGLCTYYDLEKNPGIKIKARPQERFAYMDNPEIADKLLDFNEGEMAKVNLHLPKIHCSSCIWLLENLYKLEKGIVSSRVQFLKKEISITYRKNETNLRRIVEVLDSFGYTPEINLENYEKKVSKQSDKSLLYKIGIAGFCSGNIMLLSFPDYFGLDGIRESAFSGLFGYLNLLLALPVVFYAASEYFVSAYKGLVNNMLNLDVPIAFGMAAIFLRSIYEVMYHIGSGYFDSLTGLIFFLLIGKWYQNRTYTSFSFERDYQSYFPVAITELVDNKELSVPIKQLKVGNRILIRSNEIIPADGILEEGDAYIDYSFVTGESLPIPKKRGDLIYAGGRQVGNAIQLNVQKEVSNSYLLQLWNQEVFHKKNDAYLSSFVLTFSKYFVYGTLVIALFTSGYWYVHDSSKLLFALTSVLLVACPCALALSLPFALSNSLRWLGKYGLYLKNADTVEKLAEIDTIVFDKTGTLTRTESASMEYEGQTLSEEELSFVKSAARQSTHPLSQVLYKNLSNAFYIPDSFQETPSQGIVCSVKGREVKLGAASFVGMERMEATNESRVYLAMDGVAKGCFKVQNQYRQDIEKLLPALSKRFELHLLSGDNESEKKNLSTYFAEQHMSFHQKPANKLDYIQRLKAAGKKVLMLGDGLNDAGALKAADVGISVSEDVYNFSPACDGILEGKKLSELMSFIHLAKSTIAIIKTSLMLSLFYNGIGLYFAVQGLLSPMVAAILMPISSVTIVLFVVMATNLAGKKCLNITR